MEPAEVSRRLAATTSVAKELGLSVEDTTVIQRANRLTVRLEPCDVLARVAATVRRNQEIAAFEVDIARRLEQAGAPVAVLEPRVEPHVYLRDGFAITLWKYYEPLSDDEIPPADYAQALERLHEAMRQLEVPAPHFTDRVDEAQSIVADPSRSPELADADRELLADTLRTLRRAVVDRGTDEQLLHGEPHPGNLLSTESGPRFIDFETCCHGPIEFDIAHAPDEVGDHYAGADQLQVRDCRILSMAMVASWRADRDDIFPNGRQMRDELLAEVRDALDHYGIEISH